MNYIRRNWEPLIVLLALLLGLALGARAIFADSPIIIVHTGETRVLQWNPDTSEEVHEQLPDGNVRTIVRPKEGR